MAAPPKLPPKREIALSLLDGPSVFVHLDPRRDGVVVPKALKNQPQLVLQVGFNMAIAIPDLDAGVNGIACTLSFSRTPIWCFLPWTAIYGLVGEDGRGMIWPDDVPAEIEAMRDGGKAPKPAPKKRPKLARVSALAATSEANSELPSPRRSVARPLAEPRVRLASVSPGAPTRGDAPHAEAAPPRVDEVHDGNPKKRKFPSYLRVVK
ncbi:MAG: hypothetical protein EXR75_00960 [Myxococcales bacterium]|nr:hypothetical protein [Myxococcales bacterium]